VLYFVIATSSTEISLGDKSLKTSERWKLPEIDRSEEIEVKRRKGHDTPFHSILLVFFR
jgi:hypothetical protein